MRKAEDRERTSCLRMLRVTHWRTDKNKFGWTFTYNIGDLSLDPHTITAVLTTRQGSAPHSRLTTGLALLRSRLTSHHLVLWIRQLMLQTPPPLSSEHESPDHRLGRRLPGWFASRRIQFQIGPTVPGDATLGGLRRDVANAWNQPSFARSGWSLTYNIGNLPPGPQTVTAVALNSEGCSPPSCSFL